MSPLSALERVGRDVHVLILQCLAAVSRLSRAFRPLPALTFRHDRMNALLGRGAEVVDAASTATGQLSYLELHLSRLEQPGRSTLFTCPRSLSSLPHLSAYMTLYIVMRLPDDTEARASLRCVLRSALLAAVADGAEN